MPPPALHVVTVVPHFPTQTHVFFWREMQALAALGWTASVLSTRPPPAAETCHRWTADAVARTTYLTPLRPGAALGGLLFAFARAPSRGGEVLRRVRAAKAQGGCGWARGLALAALGAVAARRMRALGAVHVHAHSCADAALIACFAAAWAGTSYSMTLHGPLEHYGGAQDLKWRTAAFGIAVTRKLRDELLAAVPGLDPARVHVAAMGVDVGLFRRRVPWAPPAAGAPWRVVTCGRLHRGKGHQDLVAAIGLLRDAGRDVRLTILGEGPDRGLVEARVRELGLGDRVTLAGAVDEGRVRDELESAHVFALGSHDEAIGVATMEAMAMELPVVVTDVGGVRELVREGTDGAFVPPGDPAAMAGAITRVISDPDAARAMGAAGAARVRSSFHSGVSAALLDRCIREALAARGSR